MKPLQKGQKNVSFSSNKYLMFNKMSAYFIISKLSDTASVENYMDRQRRVQEKGKDLIAQIQSVSENMKSNADKLSTTLTSEIQKQFNSIFKRLVIYINMAILNNLIVYYSTSI